MKIVKTFFISFIAQILLIGCNMLPHEKSEIKNASIGSVFMQQDRALVLSLRAENGDMIGESQFVYLVSDPDYKKIYKHVAPIKPGETKQVAPWPENLQKTD